MRRVYYAKIASVEAPTCFGQAFVEHLCAITNEERRKMSLSAWRLLERALLEMRIFRIPTVAFLERGKPYFLKSSLHFNISHSGELCAVSLADCPTGVDVERVRNAYSPALVRRSLSPAEAASFDGDFTRLWCRKESMAKLTGVGLAMYPMYLDTTESNYAFSEDMIFGITKNKYRICAAFEDDAERAEWIYMDIRNGF